ncbi:MAG: hypothetical protein GXX98_08470 [Planctomycetes bacterium]|jgi:hypothetical protein|nr:hypothetical protein [Planctomycetota bacterium]
MTGIRKYRRAKAPWRDRATRPAKRPREFLLREYLLVAGLIMAGLGAFFGAHEYDVYCVGRLEGIDNSRLGTEYVPEVPPGDPDRRTAAVAGFAVAALGVAIAALALVFWGLDIYTVRGRTVMERTVETRSREKRTSGHRFGWD